MPSRPAMASRCTTALVDPPIAASATIALWNEPFVRKVLGRRSGRDHLDGEPAGARARPRAAGCPGPACRRRPGIDGAERLGHQRHRRGGAHRVAVAAAADHRRLRAQELRRCDSVPARTSSRQPPDVGAAAERHAAEGAGQHRAAGHDDGRQVDRGGRHQQRRDRLVAAAEQHDAVDRVGPEHLLGGHRGHVAPEHRRRPDLRLAERDHRQLERDAAGLVDAVLHRRGDLGQVRVAGRQVGGGVGDGDLRAPGEGVRRHAAAHPGAVDVGVAVVAGVPLGAAKYGRHRVVHPPERRANFWDVMDITAAQRPRRTRVPPVAPR